MITFPNERWFATRRLVEEQTRELDSLVTNRCRDAIIDVITFLFKETDFADVDVTRQDIEEATGVALHVALLKPNGCAIRAWLATREMAVAKLDSLFGKNAVSNDWVDAVTYGAIIDAQEDGNANISNDTIMGSIGRIFRQVLEKANPEKFTL